MAAADEQLIDRFRRGDAESFAHIVARWDGRVCALAYRLLQDADSAEDVRQAAFLRAYGRLREFNG
ncbi:MAG: RNA polymerase subunit sigma-24, partial [Gemmatimonadales bacterium]|nr:RNA polymerase subunit sigma-24 [Gemmatimonadales bacterium]